MNLYGYDIRKSFDDYDKYRIPQISMPHAGDYFRIALKSVCNQKGIPDDKTQFLPEYEKVIEWLTDNKSKGLIMGGANGRGSKDYRDRYTLRLPGRGLASVLCS